MEVGDRFEFKDYHMMAVMECSRGAVEDEDQEEVVLLHDHSSHMLVALRGKDEEEGKLVHLIRYWSCDENVLIDVYRSGLMWAAHFALRH